MDCIECICCGALVDENCDPDVDALCVECEEDGGCGPGCAGIID